MKLTNELTVLLQIIGAVSRGNRTEYTEKALAESGIDTEKIRSIAALHGVDYLYKYGVGCKAEIMSAVMNRMQGRERLLAFLKEIEDAGIEVIVLKGMALAESYSEPYLRMSNDTDLFVKECDEQRLNSFLANKGFTVSKRPKTCEHGHASHPTYGLFETHVKYVQDKLSDYWKDITQLDIFRVPSQPPIIIHGRQGDIKTLDYTEHYLFMCLHMMKHFLSMESNFKIILDVNVFGNTYNDKIDWNYIWDVMSRLGYDKTLMATYAVGERIMKFPHFCERDIEIEDELMHEYIDIIADVSENEKVADEFHDIFWSDRIGKRGGIFGKIAMIVKTIPYLPEYIQKETFGGAVKRGLKKAVKIIFSTDHKNASGNENEAIKRRNSHFESLGLM